MWSEGDTVVLRSVFRGHIRVAFPHRLVESTQERVVLYLAPGTRWKRFAGPPLHDVDDLESHDWSLRDATWERTRCLRTTQFGAAHSVDHYWDAATGEFLHWYVNLQEPLRPSPVGFDTRDQALDVIIQPNGTWSWKDEDHLAAAVERGRFTAAEAAAVRAEANRVIEAWPFPTGWENWRPDPEWKLPRLPPRWDAPSSAGVGLQQSLQ
jgi:uncharacterized protein